MKPMTGLAKDWIKHLRLTRHPEGGYFRETYRAGETIPRSGLPPRFSGPRAFSTAIFFLLPAGEFSAFHRLCADEIWHFYQGDSLILYLLSPQGTLRKKRLGPLIKRGETPQIAVPHGTWLAAEVEGTKSFSLAGCTVAPGFCFDDFELADPEKLSEEFPRHRSLIHRLCRNQI